MKTQIGVLSQRIIELLELSEYEPGTPIFLGEKNIEHMKNDHEEDYNKYGDKIDEIIASPSYVAKHPNKDSIEYIKIFEENKTNYVLVAVRASGKGIMFARTLFVMANDKVERYMEKEALKKY